MNPERNSRILFSGLRMMSRSKLRTFIMMLSIIIGITALTLTLTIGNGIERKVLANVRRMVTPENIVITAEKIETEGVHESEKGPNTAIKIEDIEAIASQVDGIVLYDYLQVIPKKEVNYSGVNHFTTVKGCRTEGQRIWNKPVTQGRFFDQSELIGTKRVAVLGPKLAKILFHDEDPIGKQFSLGDAPFMIIGIAEAQGADVHGSDLDDEIYIPITTLMRRVANIDYLFGAKFLFESELKSAGSESAIRNILRERHSLKEGEADDFTMITPVLVKAFVGKIVRVFKVLLPTIAGISLLAGAIFILVLMNMAVNQRRKEIGLRKAVGAREKDISRQFFAETISVVFIGGIVGLIIGLLISMVISAKMNTSFYIPVQTLLAGIVLPILTGLIAGIIPARKASKLNPVDTMK
ncbi:MAG: ABC transporter permease [Bacteroidales bacterium]|jgi:ABC-type antimicrobial peptide transport system permease subunit|nr:ABC transporter permease [Bacteroidales bacterium]